MRAVRFALLALFFLISLAGLHAAEVELKSLDAKNGVKSKYGPYVGVFAGTSTGQSADLTIDYVGHSLDYDVLDYDGAFMIGFEVGYSWKTRYYLELGLEFEGLFSSTEVESVVGSGNEGEAVALSDVASAKADMNFAAFMVNGSLTLDLSRLKPRIGPWLSRLRPFVGGGVGGAQVWFLNQEVTSIGDTAGISTAASSDIFSTDQFVFAYQYFAGLEVQLTKKLSVYTEYKKIQLEKVSDLDNFQMESWVGGLHLRY